MAMPDIKQFCYLSLQVWSLHGERNVQTYLTKVRSSYFKVIHILLLQFRVREYYRVAICSQNQGSDKFGI